MISETIENTNDLGIKNSSARVLPEGTVCLSRTASVGYVVVLGCRMATSQDFVNWVCSSELEPRFLQYLLLFEKPSLAKFSSGAVHQTIYFPEVKAFHVCLPSAEEQRRIVAVLDKAFIGIDAAAANAQKNLTNAHSLFGSYLRSIFDAPNADWQQTTLAKITSKIGSGSTPRGGKDAYKDDGTPLIRSMNVHDRHFKARNLAFIDENQALRLKNVEVHERDVLLNITGASVARCCLAPEEMAGSRVNQHVAIIRPNDDIIRPEFLELVLTSPHYKDILLGVGEKGGSTRQAITKAEIQTLMVSFPPLTDQGSIVDHATKLQIDTRNLAVIAGKKLAALTELKYSVLRNAFTGELAAAVATQNTSVANDNFSTPQATAHIIAFAHRRHQLQSHQQTYGRVKAQKSLHLVESIGGIDLGRQPMKDAAGPNDFPHMLRAEEWAEARGFFKFVPRASGNGYDFKKLANYDALWADAVAATKPVAAALEKAIDPIVPMVSLHAEVFATVHAAWNNLIRDGAAITDDTIVKAARDDWHSAKLKIPEHKFRDAIRTIKAKNVEPDGSAKYVGGQVKLI